MSIGEDPSILSPDPGPLSDPAGNKCRIWFHNTENYLSMCSVMGMLNTVISLVHQNYNIAVLLVK